MSVSAVLIPLAIGIIASVNNQNEMKKIRSKEECIKLNTRFKDSNILQKTLNEYGLKPKKTSSNGYAVKFSDGDIIYSRPSEDVPFSMTIKNIKDKDSLIKELKEIEYVYNGNVQEYTYKRILNKLPEGMEIESEEVLEDDTILITLSVD